MGNIYDYFAAPDDRAAGATASVPGGPAAAGYDTVQLKRIDPAVTMGTLEEILTGRPYEAVTEDPRWCLQVDAATSDADRGVLTMTDGLAGALATVDRERLADVALRWCRTEEMSTGPVVPEEAAGVIAELCDLAGRATEKEHRLYCWWSL